MAIINYNIQAKRVCDLPVQHGFFNCCCARWKSEVSELQQSLESRKQEFDKQSHFLNRMQKLVAYQKSEIAKLQASEDNCHSVVLKNESLELQLKVKTLIIPVHCFVRVFENFITRFAVSLTNMFLYCCQMFALLTVR